MNLYLRFLYIFIKSVFARKQSIFTVSRLNFRVLLFDCDINFHLNNARYLSFMDLGRFYLMGQTKLLKKVYKNRWLPVITAAEINYVRALKPGEKFQLITEIIGWDDNYIYLQQCFKIKKGIAATALVKGTFIVDGKKANIQDIIDLIEPGTVSPDLPETIEHWKYLTELKKNNRYSGKS